MSHQRLTIMKTLCEVTIVALAILTLSLGIAEITIQSFVVDRVNQLYYNPNALTHRPDCGQRCYALLAGMFLKQSHLVSKVNTLAIMTGIFSFSVGILSSVHILLRQTWNLGFLSCLASVAAIVFGSGTLTYAFVTEYSASHISLKDFLRSNFRLTRESLLCQVHEMFAGDGEAGLLRTTCDCARAGRWMLLPILIILVVLTIAVCIHFERTPLGPTLTEEPLEKATVDSNEEQQSS